MSNGHVHIAAASGSSSQVDGGAVVVGVALATAMLVVGLVGLLLVLVRKRAGSGLGRRLDQAASSLGFTGEDLGPRGQRWHGAWGNDEVVVGVTPGSSKAAEELVIHVPIANTVRPLLIAATHRLVLPLGEHPLHLPPSLGHLVAFGDATTLQRLLASATAQARLGEIVGDREGFDTRLTFTTGALELRVMGTLSPRLDAGLLHRLLEACRDFTEALL